LRTKHEQILDYIESLRVGSRISVRTIARTLDVSEGTAYRAIKEAELQGLVSTIERIGTVRIERKEKKNIERLTYAEVVNIVGGTVLGGKSGLYKTLNKFIIGAMQLEAAVRYIEPGSLMIVGNREQMQRMSLLHGAAVLITGGFEASEEVQALANERELPIISCSYDTFTTAALINRAIYDRLIKKDILFVEDVMSTEQLAVITKSESVADYRRKVEMTGHAILPVVDESDRVVGIVSPRDVSQASPEHPIEVYMVKQPVTVPPKTTVASVAHRMVWEGIEFVPVVHNKKLVGVLSRQDVIKALQFMNRQPQIGETWDDVVTQDFQPSKNEDATYSLRGKVTPQMTSAAGTLALGALTTLMESAATLMLEKNRGVDMVVDNLVFYFLKPISIDSEIEVRARLLDSGQRLAKVDVEVFDGNEQAAKALLTLQKLER
jgi:predicted transcriptional regulator